MKTVCRQRNVMLVFLLFYVLAWSIPVSAQENKYTLYDLGTLGGLESWAYDINDSGQIVGKTDTNNFQEGSRLRQAFIGTKDGITYLISGDTTRSSAKAISSDGKVVGFQNDSAFLADADADKDKESLIDFGVFPDDTVTTWGLGINKSGNMVGWDGIWEKGGSGYTKYSLGDLGGAYTRATSVNDLNQVAGLSLNSSGSLRAFRWQKENGTGIMTDLKVLKDKDKEFLDSYATRINNNGEVVGYSLTGGEIPLAHACLWKNDGNNTIIDLEGSESTNYSEAYGINDATVVVGMRLLDGVESAFIWDAKNGMRDLNSLIPAGSGWVLAAAYAINNKGEIVGYGHKNGSSDYSAFLLTPPLNDEPDGPFEIGIDILPWNVHNQVNWHAQWGLIPVAILSDKDFHASRVVVKKSLKFGRTGNEDSLAFCMPWNWDVNYDGRKDLICYFHEGPAKFQCDDKEGILRGKTKDGEEFEGRDLVQVVPCKPIRNHR